MHRSYANARSVESFLKSYDISQKKYFVTFEIALIVLDDYTLYFLKDSAEN